MGDVCGIGAAGTLGWMGLASDLERAIAIFGDVSVPLAASQSPDSWPEHSGRDLRKFDSGAAGPKRGAVAP